MTKTTLMSLALAAAALTAAPAAAETWQVLTSSDTTGYLVDTASLAPDDGAVLVTVARVPRRDREATDFSYSTDRFAIRCADRKTRLVESADFGPDGAEEGRYPETEDFVSIQRNTFDDMVRAVACDLATPPGPAWPSVRGYIEAGRPE